MNEEKISQAFAITSDYFNLRAVKEKQKESAGWFYIEKYRINKKLFH